MNPRCKNPDCKWHSEKATDYCSFECRVMSENEKYGNDLEEMAKVI